MSEEKIFITEFGSGEFSIHDEIADVRFFATELLWFIPGEDFVEVGVSWNSMVTGELRNAREEILGNWKGVPSE